eukprot:scaffold2923_cov208-Prasinococcus_capsulatus_cf.AAC.1
MADAAARALLLPLLLLLMRGSRAGAHDGGEAVHVGEAAAARGRGEPGVPLARGVRAPAPQQGRRGHGRRRRGAHAHVLRQPHATRDARHARRRAAGAAAARAHAPAVAAARLVLARVRLYIYVCTHTRMRARMQLSPPLGAGGALRLQDPAQQERRGAGRPRLQRGLGEAAHAAHLRAARIQQQRAQQAHVVQPPLGSCALVARPPCERPRRDVHARRGLAGRVVLGACHRAQPVKCRRQRPGRRPGECAPLPPPMHAHAAPHRARPAAPRAPRTPRRPRTPPAGGRARSAPTARSRTLARATARRRAAARAGFLLVGAPSTAPAAAPGPRR